MEVYKFFHDWRKSILQIKLCPWRHFRKAIQIYKICVFIKLHFQFRPLIINSDEDHRINFTKIASPNTASPTLRVIKINIKDRELVPPNIKVISIIVLRDNISNTRRREIKWFFLFVKITIKMIIQIKI